MLVWLSFGMRVLRAANGYIGKWRGRDYGVDPQSHLLAAVSFSALFHNLLTGNLGIAHDNSIAPVWKTPR